MSMTRGGFLKALVGMGLLPSVLVGRDAEATEAPPEPQETTEAVREDAGTVQLGGVRATFTPDGGKPIPVDVLTMEYGREMMDVTAWDDEVRQWEAGQPWVAVEAYLPKQGFRLEDTGTLVLRYGDIRYTVTDARVIQIEGSLIGEPPTCVFHSHGGQVARVEG